MSGSGNAGSATAGQSQRWTRTARSSMSLPPLRVMVDLTGGGALDELARAAFYPGIQLRRFEEHFDHLHRHVDHLGHRLAHGGQRMGRPTGHGDVVEADDREIAGNVQSELPARRVHEADGEDIVGAEYAIRAVAPLKQPGGGFVSPLIGEGAGLDAHRFLKSMIEASALKAFPTVDGRGGVRTARHEGKATMTKLDQMIGDEPA